MQEAQPIWPFFVAVLISFTIGSVVGRLGKSTSWKPVLALSTACMSLSEPALMILYENGFMPLEDALRMGQGLVVAGTLGSGFASQRFEKLIKAKQPLPKEGMQSVFPSELSEVGLMGKCPNCISIIPASSSECTHCKALFSGGSGWKVGPQ